jgi:hypothetical protein
MTTLEVLRGMRAKIADEAPSDMRESFWTWLVKITGDDEQAYELAEARIREFSDNPTFDVSGRGEFGKDFAVSILDRAIAAESKGEP